VLASPSRSVIAIDDDLVVVTENWRDFHFVEEILFLDVRMVSRVELPVLHVRQPERGRVIRENACCRDLLRRRAG
jgi:hypothetical protein